MAISHDPGLTAQRFQADPFAEAAGVRWYRSGDKGRRRPDGHIDHLGRLDNQVKLRGFRIELDEIRNRLLEARGIHAAAVVVDEHHGRLDAYITGETPDLAELRTHLVVTLPHYMVPATITVLEHLPLTSNGKLDRGRLPKPSSAAEASSVALASVGGGALLERIADAWNEVLGARIGPDENFFFAGGNSLLAIRIANRLRSDGLAAANVRLLYAHPTVRKLAAALAPAD